MKSSILASYLVVVMVIPLVSSDTMINVNQQQQQQQNHSISRMYEDIRNQPLRIPSSSIKSGCPAEFHKYGDYCFHLCDARLTASDAVSYCSGLSATLPFPIGDLAKWQKSVVKAIHDLGYSSWSGAMKDSDDGVWRWPDNTEVPKDAWWQHGPPDKEDYACSSIDANSGALYDCSCSPKMHVICQVSTGIYTTTTAETTVTTEGPATTPGVDMCYSCIGCAAVNSSTNVLQRDLDQSCFTAFHGDITTRGVVPQQHLDGECETVGHDLYCYCNTNLCNNFKKLPETTEDKYRFADYMKMTGT